jgi:hypothetical protein
VDRAALARLVQYPEWSALQDLLSRQETFELGILRSTGDLNASESIRNIHKLRELIAMALREPDGTLKVNPFPKEIK